MAVTPSPAQGAALRQLGMLHSDELPALAADWLTEYDSPALRRLAGLSGSEGWLNDQLWPEVLTDLGADEVSGDEAWDLAITFQLALWRAGTRTTVDVMRQVTRAYTDSGYPRCAAEAGRLYAFDRELSSGGRARGEVLAEVEQALTELAELRDLRL